MTRWFVIAVLVPLLAVTAHAQPGGRRPTFNEAVTQIEATIEPTTVRRGETVTWRLKMEVIPGWHTYPSVQSEAAAKSYVNKFLPYKAGDKIKDTNTPAPVVLAFVGPLTQPASPHRGPIPDDPNKSYEYFEGAAVWEWKAVVVTDVPPGPVTVQVPVKILVCDDAGCLPPKSLTLETKITIANGPPIPIDPKYETAVKEWMTVPAAATSDGNTIKSAPPTAAAIQSSANAANYSKSLDALEAEIVVGDKSVTPTNTGLWAFLGTAALWGIISLFTPCVFPMIPITVSFFLKQSEKKHLNPVLQASIYCGTIVIVLAIAALTLLSLFRDMSVRPLTNIALGLLFILLALSLLGMFELTLPNFITRFTSARESKGGLVGTIFMALTFTVVSFTCVAPFLGGFAGIVSSGQFRWWEMVLGAFAFSGAFAAPFFILALFPSLLRQLPRSGGWLNSVKVVMGFLEIAAALKFFRTAELRLLPQAEYFTYDLVLGLWVALSILCGLYLINVFRIGHDEPLESIGVPRFLWGFLFIGLGFYMLPGLFANGAERMRPTGAVFAWVDAFLLPDGSDLPWTVDLPKAVADARTERNKTGKPQYVFVDFTGVTCTNCKYNEKSVFSRPEIKNLFKPYKLVQMYTDEVPANFFSAKTTDEQREREAEANLKFQKRKFGSEQLPLYVILEPLPDGKVQVVEAYKEGKINRVEQFADFLKRPFAEDKSQAAR